MYVVWLMSARVLVSFDYMLVNTNALSYVFLLS